MTKQVMHQARDALAPLANAHFPIERENLSDDDVSKAGSAIAALEEAIAAPEISALKAAQPEQGLVYQYRMVSGSWIDQPKESYDYNVKLGQAVVRVLYASPQIAQPAPAEPEQKAYRRPVTNRCPKCVGLSCLCDGLCTKPVATSQPEPAAPYQVTGEDVKAALSTYYAITGLDEFAEESLQDMRKALEKHEARKATA